MKKKNLTSREAWTTVQVNLLSNTNLREKINGPIKKKSMTVDYLEIELYGKALIFSLYHMVSAIDWTFVSPNPQFMYWNLIPKMMVSGDDYEDEGLMNGISAPIKEAPIAPLPLSTTWWHSKKTQWKVQFMQ